MAFRVCFLTSVPDDSMPGLLRVIVCQTNPRLRSSISRCSPACSMAGRNNNILPTPFIKADVSTTASNLPQEHNSVSHTSLSRTEKVNDDDENQAIPEERDVYLILQSAAAGIAFYCLNKKVFYDRY